MLCLPALPIELNRDVAGLQRHLRTLYKAALCLLARRGSGVLCFTISNKIGSRTAAAAFAVVVVVVVVDT